jgi:hypothetical protein
MYILPSFQLHFIQRIARLIKKNEEHLFPFCNLQTLIIYDSFIIFSLFFMIKVEYTLDVFLY